jgi:hypothetical protein
MRPLILSAFSLLILALISCTLSLSPAQAEPATLPPILAITIDSPARAKHNVLTAVWADGAIVWSKDQQDGGPPYLTAKIDPAKTTAFLAKLDKDGVFRKTPDDLVHVGPDASYHRIDLTHGKQHVDLISWHELFERKPNLIATSRGIQSEPDREARAKLIANDAPSYKAFRTLWKDIRTFTTTLIPENGKGEPYQGELKWEFPRD